MLNDDSICDMAKYTIDNKSTVRKTAEAFFVSKSTVYENLTQRLPYISANLWSGVQSVIETNKKERHIRGGYATKLKHAEIKHAKLHKLTN